MVHVFLRARMEPNQVSKYCREQSCQIAFHQVCRQATSQVSHTSTDGGATTPALHCWPPSIRCAGSDSLELCLMTFVHSRTMYPSNGAWELGCSLVTSVHSALETLWQCAIQIYFYHYHHHLLQTRQILLSDGPKIPNFWTSYKRALNWPRVRKVTVLLTKDSSNSARCSGRTKTKVMGDDTEVPKAPRLRCRVLHGVHNRSGGNPPVPPVIRALARWATVVEQCQIRCWPVASMRHHCLLCWQGTRTFVGLVVLQHPMEPGMN